MERERDEAREAASAGRRPHQELEEAYRKERAAHGRTRRWAVRLGVTAFVLLALLIASVLLWWLVLR